MASLASPAASNNLRARTRWHLFLLLHANPSLKRLRKKALEEFVAKRALDNARQAAASPAAAASDSDVRLPEQQAVEMHSVSSHEHTPLL